MLGDRLGKNVGSGRLGRHSLESWVHKPDVVTQFLVARFSSPRAYLQCLWELPRIWELGVRAIPSNDCIFLKCGGTEGF